MNELIKITPDGKITARELYDFLQLNPTHWSRWAKTNIEQDSYYEEGKDWIGFAIVANGNETKDYHLTIDFAKHLCMLSRSERGKQARSYFVEIENRHKEQQKQLATADPLDMVIMLAQNAKNVKEQMKQLDNRMAVIEARQITSPTEYFTVAGYANLKSKKIGLATANILGRKAADISRKHGYEIGKTSDPRYGQVNTYHIDMLEMVFEENQGGLW